MPGKSPSSEARGQEPVGNPLPFKAQASHQFLITKSNKMEKTMPAHSFPVYSEQKSNHHTPCTPTNTRPSKPSSAPSSVLLPHPLNPFFLGNYCWAPPEGGHQRKWDLTASFHHYPSLTKESNKAGIEQAGFCFLVTQRRSEPRWGYKSCLHDSKESNPSISTCFIKNLLSQLSLKRVQNVIKYQYEHTLK